MNKMEKTMDFRQELLQENIIPMDMNDISKKYQKDFLNDIKTGTIKTNLIKKCQCGSKSLEVLANVDRFGLPFKSLICQSCGLITTSPQIAQESLAYYYEKYYHPINYGKESIQNQAALYQNGQGDKIYEIVQKYLPKKNKLTVLEIGAGTGNVLSEFKSKANQHGIEISELGTEYSSDCIEACQHKDINVIQGDIQTVLKMDKKYDLIILSHVFEHFIDLGEELNKINTLMTNESILYIEVPGIFINHDKKYYKYSFLPYLIHAHMYNFSLNTLESLVSKYGFNKLYGNENVELVLKKGENNLNINDYNRILWYLSFLHDNQQLFLTKENSLTEQSKKIAEQEKSLTEQSKKIAEQEKSLTEQSKKIAEQEDKVADYYLLLNQIDSITQNEILSHPIKKFKSYKHMLTLFHKLKRKQK